MNNAFKQTIRRLTTLPRLPVVYHDEGIVVINKPSGLVSQGSIGGGDPLAAIKQHIQKEYGYPNKLHTVHRLDKLTTGSMILATSPRMAANMAVQFKQREIDKVYLALVRGRLEESEGTITHPLNTIDGIVSASRDSFGKECRTSWEVLSQSDGFSLLRVVLHTGHKHQIRVHLAQCLGVPVVGDALYGKPSRSHKLFLHASRITMTRFGSASGSGHGKQFRLGVCAPLPDYFVEKCDKVGIKCPEDAITGGVFANGECMVDGQVANVNGRWVGS